MSATRDFDWIADADDVIVNHQPATAIYTNPAGGIVLRQQGKDFDGDVVAIVQPAFARVVAAAILREAGHDDLATKVDSPKGDNHHG